ncbi:sigma-54 dependent transcriptional regulator [Comamonas sp. BIGb0124]|uniref:sigma-54-dependent transcriptional regulator n=1 Tax=Comamonas sp. BIGb0124 TaxID=2485130 RepID=UPI00272B94B0|nr:sigma-54 dependent transcriptional regulator [Comamonas sp. BIGb0124]
MHTELSVLIVEDDLAMQLGCVQALQLAGLRARAVGTVEAALPLIAPGFAGAVVTDMRLPGQDGLALVRYVQQVDANIPVIMITGHGDVTLAVEAMRSGAYDFMTKPFAPDILVEVVRRALEKRALTLEVSALRATLSRREGVAKLVGQSPQMEKIRRLVVDIADSPVDILVHGETGTGKELVAQALHDLSSRRHAPFVALNCGGMPDNLLDSELFGHEPGAFTGAQKRRIGKIEHANGGTLFLDELESMPMGMQIKLLRVLQERQIERVGSNQPIAVDVRIVAATKDDLLERARRGNFRADLYYRLNVVTLHLPALRERREDVPLLLEHFLLLAASRFSRPLPHICDQTLRELMAHDWPGNVRELRNAADCLALGVHNDIFAPAGEPGVDGGHTSLSLAESVESYERNLIAAELRRHDGSVSRSARALRIARATLNDKIRKYGLSAA